MSRLVSMTDLRSEVRADEDDERRLSRKLSSVIRLLESETGRLWERRVDHVERFRTETDEKTLFLDLKPVESVVVKEKAEGDAAFVEVDAEDYELDAELGSVERLQPPTLVPVFDPSIGLRRHWLDFVEATVTGGFTHDGEGGSAETPADLVDAVIEQVRYDWHRNKDETVATKTQGFEGGSTTFRDGALHPTFERFVSRFRRRF